MRASDIALGADVYVMWNSIDCGEKRTRGPIQGASSVNCSISVLINNIKGKTWLKVDEMKSLYNAKPRGEERREKRGGEGRGGMADISFRRQPGRQDIAPSVRLKKQITRLSSLAD